MGGLTNGPPATGTGAAASGNGNGGDGNGGDEGEDGAFSAGGSTNPFGTDHSATPLVPLLVGGGATSAIKKGLRLVVVS